MGQGLAGKIHALCDPLPTILRGSARHRLDRPSGRCRARRGRGPHPRGNAPGAPLPVLVLSNRRGRRRRLDRRATPNDLPFHPQGDHGRPRCGARGRAFGGGAGHAVLRIPAEPDESKLEELAAVMTRTAARIEARMVADLADLEASCGGGASDDLDRPPLRGAGWEGEEDRRGPRPASGSPRQVDRQRVADCANTEGWSRSPRPERPTKACLQGSLRQLQAKRGKGHDANTASATKRAASQAVDRSGAAPAHLSLVADERRRFAAQRISASCPDASSWPAFMGLHGILSARTGSDTARGPEPQGGRLRPLAPRGASQGNQRRPVLTSKGGLGSAPGIEATCSGDAVHRVGRPGDYSRSEVERL
jgi:hypothetical protein